MSYEHYGQLALLFDFPQAEFVIRGRELLDFLRKNYPDAADEVGCFLDGIAERTLDQQELHTRTFDVQSITTLDIGYVLFGDDYKRAELLSHLTFEHKQVGNDCGGELADHLPNVLRLIPRLMDQDLTHDLVSEILVPALMLMIREFDPERIEKKNVSYQKHYKTLIESAPGGDLTIYGRALKALLYVLMKDFQVMERVAKLADGSGARQSADFLGLIEKEIEIENNANPVNSGGDS
jgi:nitrate reductase assembly molybdenum cofactor insertion protein NarJ